MIIRTAGIKDISAAAELAVLLWPEHQKPEMEKMFRDILANPEAICALATQENLPVGFCHCQLRNDYVEGTETSPVAYLEGIYVAKEYRRQGIAKAMLHFCEGWARQKNCTEMASDCELQNHESESFHGRLGFAEANRVICFVKKL